MAKNAPIKNQHAFAAWVLSTVPKGCWVKITATRTYQRKGGFRSEDFTLRIALDHYGKKIEQTSHDLSALALWLKEIALPELFPPPRSVSVQRVERRGVSLTKAIP